MHLWKKNKVAQVVQNKKRREDIKGQSNYEGGFALTEAIIGSFVILLIFQSIFFMSSAFLHLIHSAQGGNELLMDSRYARILMMNRIQKAEHGLTMTRHNNFVEASREVWSFGLYGTGLVVGLSNGRKQSISQELIDKSFGYVAVSGPREGIFSKGPHKTLQMEWKSTISPTKLSEHVYNHKAYKPYEVRMSVLPDYIYYHYGGKINDIYGAR